MSTVDLFLKELDEILSKIRRVRTGDFVLPEDHNLQREAIVKISEIIKNLEGLFATQAYSLEEPMWSGYRFVKRLLVKEFFAGESLRSGPFTQMLFMGEEPIVLNIAFQDTTFNYQGYTYFISIPVGTVINKHSFSIVSFYIGEDEPLRHTYPTRKYFIVLDNTKNTSSVYRNDGLCLLEVDNNVLVDYLANSGYTPGEGKSVVISPSGKYFAIGVAGYKETTGVELACLIDLYEAY